MPDSARYTPPELARSGWDAVKKSPHSAVDSFGFGLLIFEVFNGSFSSADQAGQTKGIPPTMHAGYKRLVNANPKARLSVGNFLEQGKRKSSFFDTPLIKLTDGIDNLGVKSDQERTSLFEYAPFPFFLRSLRPFKYPLVLTYQLFTHPVTWISSRTTFPKTSSR